MYSIYSNSIYTYCIYSIYTICGQVPVDLLFRLTIPVVDTERPRNNWCQYLAILHTVLGTKAAISI